MRSSFAFENVVWDMHLLFQLVATGKTTLGYSSVLILIGETNGGNHFKATPLLLVVSVHYAETNRLVVNEHQAFSLKAWWARLGIAY